MSSEALASLHRPLKVIALYSAPKASLRATQQDCLGIRLLARNDADPGATATSDITGRQKSLAFDLVLYMPLHVLAQMIDLEKMHRIGGNAFHVSRPRTRPVRGYTDSTINPVAPM